MDKPLASLLAKGANKTPNKIKTGISIRNVGITSFYSKRLLSLSVWQAETSKSIDKKEEVSNNPFSPSQGEIIMKLNFFTVLFLTLVSTLLAPAMLAPANSFAFDIGGLKVNTPKSNTGSQAPSSNSGQVIHNSLTPQQQVVKDIKELIKSQYQIDYRWIMTGDKEALKQLIAGKFGQPKPVTNGVGWIIRPAGDSSGQCAEFDLNLVNKDSNRIAYREIVNADCL